MGGTTTTQVIDSFVALQQEEQFEQEWIDSFLNAMRKDLSIFRYQTIDDTIDYMHGSAEVIGLMLARIMRLPEAAMPFAQIQGRAMQYINFIRDIAEDNNEFSREYIPQVILRHYGIRNLSYDEAKKHSEAFIDLVRSEIKRYYAWQNEAYKGYRFISKRYITAIATAAAMYNWTADKIYRDPMCVFTGKVRPPKSVIIFHAVKLLLFPPKRYYIQ